MALPGEDRSAGEVLGAAGEVGAVEVSNENGDDSELDKLKENGKGDEVVVNEGVDDTGETPNGGDMLDWTRVAGDGSGGGGDDDCVSGETDGVEGASADVEDGVED
ncbi:hypothetical protein PHLCEN_2v380 [Hermanssonia centrifuga]|uniref:Uncharacterized protein n=1 Tax=Hermanssonia centrifuga TaxID=98765 RepID=A0A2R6S6E3_9APHY|nr:hypothetical protein PHLCEN_2v380 [Hermanssonia centrifuga]